jgi:FG-GAP-like repeat
MKKPIPIASIVAACVVGMLLLLIAYLASTAPLPAPLRAARTARAESGAGYVSTLNFQRTDYTTGTNPQFVAVGDFNKDGKLDMAVNNYNGGNAGTVSIFLGNGDGTFQPKVDYATGNGPVVVITADFNHDGNLDLAVANDTGSSVSVLLGNGDGTFQAHKDYPAGSFPHWVATADFDGDGYDDLAVSNEGASDVGVFLNNGDGTFGAMKTYPTASEPWAVSTGDFNKDGKQDLAVTCYYDGTACVLLGNGDGTFGTYKEYPVGNGPAAIVTADVNQDGNPDLVAAIYNSGNTGVAAVLLGNGDGTFKTAMDATAGLGPDGVAVGDFNGDGIPDLVVANLIGNNMSVLLGNGDGTYQTQQPFNTGSFPIGVAASPLGGQVAGSDDIVAANDLSASASVFLNEAAIKISGGSKPNPSKEGQSVTFTATVTPAVAGQPTPTGKITFERWERRRFQMERPPSA